MTDVRAVDVITPAAAGSLAGLFAERVRRSPVAIAYRDFRDREDRWVDFTWAQMDREVARWQAALAGDGLVAGDRVAVMLRNSPEWVAFDQAALGLGLVVVPLYTQDRPENVAYILNDCGARTLLVQGPDDWQALAPACAAVTSLTRVITVQPLTGDCTDRRLAAAAEWLPDEGGATRQVVTDPASLASIVYTSGTTGHPKGVMLSHANMLFDAYAGLGSFTVYPDDLFLSFLPLSHTFERTVGYYLAMMGGATVAYARSIPLLKDDLKAIRPTLMISVPRIYERVYAAVRAKLDAGTELKRRLFATTVAIGWLRFEHEQGRAPWGPRLLLWSLLKRLVADKVMAQLGGRMRASIAGGAALSPDVSRVFIALGLPILQGYGLTETSPVISVNRLDDNVPASVGVTLPGVEVKVADNEALLTRGPQVMLGYWGNDTATRAMIGADGWLNTGDTARIDSAGHIFITGRLKEIIVLSNGEKVPPVDMEAAILRDPLFEQVMVVGEARPYLAVIAIVNRDRWRDLAKEHGLAEPWPEVLNSPHAEEWALARVGRQLGAFPGYAQIRRLTLAAEPWSIENGLLTPTLKLRRTRVLEHHRQDFIRMYAGH